MNHKKILTQVKREFWEHKVGFVYAPIAASALLLLAALIFLLKINSSISDGKINFSLNDQLNFNGKVYSQGHEPIELSALLTHMATEGADTYQHIITTMSYANTLLLCIVFLIVMFTYAHACLFDDRKNRDILFWRSLPVSETTNVLTKVGFLILYLPLIILPLNILLSFIGAIATTVFFASKGMALAPLLMAYVESSFIASALYISLKVLASLGFLLPLMGFILCASAYAKRSPSLVSSALVVALIVIDKVARAGFDINLRISATLQTYWQTFSELNQGIVFNEPLALSTQLISHYVIALALGAGLVALAIWLRNNRYEI